MPTLRFRAISKEKALQFAGQLTERLSIIFETPIDNISIELVDSIYIRDGKIDTAPYPIVEIIAFRRSDTIENKAAAEITETLRKYGYEYSEVIYFHPEKKDYYCDGLPCDR